MSLEESGEPSKTLPFDLWEHQKRGWAMFRDHFQTPSARSIVGISPVGSGKGTLAAALLASSASMGKMACMIAPKREIVRDTARRLWDQGIDAGILMAGHAPRACHVQVATAASLYALVRAGRLDLNVFKLFVWDEAHHAVAKSYRFLREAAPNARHIGLTASPTRADGQPLDEVFEHMVQIASVNELMGKGFLCGARIIGASRFLSSSICADPIAMYKQHLAGERAVHFCKSVEEALEREAEYNAEGISCAAIHGKTPKRIRDIILSQYDAGSIQVVTNYDILTEGWDCRSTRGVIITRPYQSDVHWVQSTGRGLRAHPDKNRCVILDLCGNAKAFDVPSADRMPDEDDEEPEEKQTRGPRTWARRCPRKSCRLVLEDPSCLRHDADGCPACGFQYDPPVLRLPVEERAMEIVDDDPAGAT